MTKPFCFRTILITPGGERSYVAEEWTDALVLIQDGHLELLCRRGSRRRFAPGSVLWLTGLPLRSLLNPGKVTTRLVAVARRPTQETSVTPRRSSSSSTPKPGASPSTSTPRS